jgi:hypothetical protein
MGDGPSMSEAGYEPASRFDSWFIFSMTEKYAKTPVLLPYHRLVLSL